jgi:hypothetical protein
MKISVFESLPASIRQEITQQIYAGNKTGAIKFYCQQTGCDLAEAKLVIEKVEQDLYVSTPNAFEKKNATPKKNSSIAILLVVVGLVSTVVLASLVFLEFSEQTSKFFVRTDANQVSEVKTPIKPPSETQPLVTASHAIFRLPFDGTTQDVIGGLAVISTGRVEFVDGLFGKAAQFDGSGAKLDVPQIGVLPISTELTLEMWVNVPNWRNPYKGSPPLGSVVSRSIFYTIGVDYSSQQAQARIKTDQSGEWGVALKGGRIDADRWHYIALVYRGKEGRALLFVDGNRVDEKELHGTIVAPEYIPLTIGTWYERNQAFKGLVDEVRLSNVALDDETIRSIAQKSSGLAVR